jgi:hypothetical protein
MRYLGCSNTTSNKTSSIASFGSKLSSELGRNFPSGLFSSLAAKIFSGLAEDGRSGLFGRGQGLLHDGLEGNLLAGSLA